MNTFSLMVNARLHRGSASLYLPRFPYRTAKLFSVAATCIINNVPFLYKFKLTYNYTQAHSRCCGLQEMEKVNCTITTKAECEGNNFYWYWLTWVSLDKGPLNRSLLQG